MPDTGFDPFGLDQPRAFEAPEEGINGPFGYRKACAMFQAAQYFEAVQAPWPQSRQGGEFNATFSQLDLPLLG